MPLPEPMRRRRRNSSDSLSGFASSCAQMRRPGLTEKNMAVVRAFKDPQNRARLKALPTQLFNEALAERDARSAGCGDRRASRSLFRSCWSLRCGSQIWPRSISRTNVIRIGGPEPTYHLVIPPEDVKNDQPLEYPLPKAVSEMLERYLSVFRPRLCRVDNPWLFPGEAIGHKTKGTLSGQIIERVIKALGIRVTPHQFRHLAAAFILERDPANYEFVRRVLGHKNLETTIRFYVGLETVDAVRKYSAMALEGHDWRPKQ